MARLAVSQDERLLLHLLELDKHRDDAEVPLDASQEGISQELGIQIHNASRALSSLQNEGLVIDRLAHVRGAQRRRRAYFLTDRGRQAAQALKADLSKRKVVIDHAGKTQELPLEQAVRKLTALTGACPSFTEIVDIARTQDTISSEAFAKPCKTEPLEYTERSHGRPSTGDFFGRDSERKAVVEALSGREVSALLIWGMPGIGKSTFASKLFEESSGRRSQFWYTFREWDTESSFLSALTEFLSSAGRSRTSSVLRIGTSPAELYVPLMKDLSAPGFVIFLDDVHKPTGPLLSLIEVLMEATKASKASKIILMSRLIPIFYSKTASGHMAIELAGLDRDSAWRMAQSLSAKDTSEVVTKSHGHPLLLVLMAKGGTSGFAGDVMSFVEREVYSAIPERERDTLELLAVFRHPVKADAIQDIDYDGVSSLRKRALVVDQQDGVWVHDLLREFLASRLSQAKRATLHRRAASYCESHTGVEWKLETLYHYVEAGDWASSRRVTMSNALELAKEFPGETLALVSRIPKESSGPKELAELLFLRGQLKDSMSLQQEALADFEESLSFLTSERDSERRAVVLEAIAKLQAQIQRWSDSLAAHEKALRLYEKSDDQEGQAREWMNIGSVHRRRGDLKGARDAYGKALSIATVVEDRPAQAACLNNLGMLEWDEGRIYEAEAKLRESIRLAHTVRNHAGEARGLENLAALLRAQLRLSEAVTLLKESAEAFGRADELAEAKRVLAESANVLADQGELPEAVSVCRRTLENPSLRRRRGLFQKSARYDMGDASVSEALVHILTQSGDVKGAHRELERYAEIAESLDDKSLAGRGKLMLALLNERAEDIPSAVKALDDAESLLRAVGNDEGLTAVHMRRGMLEEKRGNDAEAAHQYREAARHAELAGNKHARAMALESLEAVSGGSGRLSPL